MVREIIKPQESLITVQLPEDMVGKTIELIAFEIEQDDRVISKQDRIKRIEELTKNTRVDLSNFKFDRNEANNYDE